MALKNRFRPPKKKTFATEETHKEVPHLRIVSNNENKEDSINQSEDLITKINVLFEKKGFDDESLTKSILHYCNATFVGRTSIIWSLNSSNKILRSDIVVGPKSTLKKQIPFGKDVAGWVAHNGESIFSNDIANDPRINIDISTKRESNKSIASPLIFRGELVGVLEIQGDKRNFDENDLKTIRALTTPLAIHYKTSQSLKDSNSIIEQMNTLNHLHESFSSTMNLDQLLSLVLNKSISLLDAQVGSIWLTTPETDIAQCRVAHGPTKERVQGVKIKVGTGIIGWVIENNSPTIIEDCSNDERFSSTLDEKIKFKTISMISAPFKIKDECVGAIQVINKTNNDTLFTKNDLNFLSLIASTAATNIKNAQLYTAQTRAEELSALIDVSKEISSTLDIDAVLMSIVNLTSDIIDYDRAVISRVHRDQLKVASISGIERIAEDDEDVISLNELHQKIMESKENISIQDFSSYESSNKQITEVTEYLKSNELNSFNSYILKDEQGELGLLTIESKKPNLIQKQQHEIFSILINQCTVALRNAELFSSIPADQVVEHLKQRVIERLLSVKSWSIQKKVGIPLAICLVLLSLFFIKVPYSVTSNLELVPLAMTHYAQSQGVVESVSVKEGQKINTGDLLLKLDVSDLVLQKKQKESLRQKTMHEMIKLQLEDRVSEFKIKEKEVLSLKYEIEILNKKIQAGNVVSSVDGRVLSEKLDELVGKPISFGDELVKIGRNDRLVAQFQIPEEEIQFVKTGQKIEFKLFGQPHKTYSENLKLTSVSGEGKQVTEQDPSIYFIATAQIDALKMSESNIRPGMTGRGKIHTDWQSLGWKLFGAPIRFLRTNLFF